MTGPHLTPEREADYREWLAKDPRYFATRARDILAALDAEREAHNLTRTALEASTEDLIAWAKWIRDHEGDPVRLDGCVQANQVALQLAVAEADKPEAPATCGYCHDPWARGHVCDPAKDWRRAKPENLRETLGRLRAKSDYFRSSDENDARKMGLGLLEAVEAIEAALKADKPHHGTDGR